MTATAVTIPASSRSFSYRAWDTHGRDVGGVIAASSTEAALQSLSRQGLVAYEVKPQRERMSLKPRFSVADMAFVLRVLADLLEAGLPLSRSLVALEEVAPTTIRSTVPRIRQEVQEGKGLSGALMAALPETPAIVTGIIRSGEAGSGLGFAVRRAAEMAEEAAAVRSMIRAALAYPMLLAASGLGAVVVLVTVVLPRFEVMFSDLGQALPPTTRFVVSAARIAQSTGPFAVAAAAVAFVSFWMWRSSETGIRTWHRILLSVPLIGPTRRSAAASRTCAALAALLETGVPLSSALHHAARAGGDMELAARLLDVRSAVVRGERLSDALRVHDATTTTVVRLVRAGEESGRMASLLSHGSRIEREFAMQRTRSMVRLLEPSLILLFGGMVALVAAAMLQAMYSIRPGV